MAHWGEFYALPIEQFYYATIGCESVEQTSKNMPIYCTHAGLKYALKKKGYTISTKKEVEIKDKDGNVVKF